MPLRVPKKVLLIVTVCALDTNDENVRAPRLGREMNSMDLTAVNNPKLKDDSRVKSSKWKVPLIWPIVELEKDVT
jgi:hypothetical protein